MAYIDCIHYGVCTFYDEKCTEQCVHFKDRENFVEVVRCKDCKHWEEIERHGGYNHNGFCMMQSKIFYSERPATDTDHFCSYGKRKEER